MKDIDNTKYTVCPCCGETVLFMKFCTECGAPLPKESETVPPPEQKNGFFPPQAVNFVNPFNTVSEIKESERDELPGENLPVDDSGLTLLGDFCKKTVATVGGDGYDETVLYENEADGSFQIHTYSKYVYMTKESHHSFKAKDGAYAALLELAEKLRLDEYEGKRGFGLCGGMYICKYKKDGVLHRVTTDNFECDGASIIMQVGNLLQGYMGEEIFRQQ